MDIDEKIFTEQIYAVRDFLFHYSSYRILNQNFSSLSKKDSAEFWVYSINAHYFQAINLWCMVFGSDNNEIHWKKLKLSQSLKPLILSDLGYSSEQYDSYWKKVRDWRNKFSAHRVPGFLESTDAPDLKLARSIIFIYEKWFNEEVNISLQFSYEKYENDFNEMVEKTIKDILSN